ncbi:MAG: hypothetical protein J6S49_06780, partial [Erysipelotrichaceae bacterium]|nr:hypothetical protein [Erysipelotrichaceae bacterium]
GTQTTAAVSPGGGTYDTGIAAGNANIIWMSNHSQPTVNATAVYIESGNTTRLIPNTTPYSAIVQNGKIYIVNNHGSQALYIDYIVYSLG